MHLLRLHFPLIILQIIGSISCQSDYSIVAPGTIHSNRNYSVCVSLHDAATAATIRLSVHSPTSSLHLSEEVTLQPHQTKTIHFMPPKIYDDFQYELKAEGIKGITLNESKELYGQGRGGPRIYVESDKGLYKPEDFVQFRVILLDEHLKAIKIVEPISVLILDPQRTRVKQFKDIQLQRGVFSSKFQLSKQPILGKWTILVHISGKYNMQKEYQFRVEKYVLPKFSVHIESDPDVVEKDRIVKATIYGKYTYGKYVEGTVEVLLMDFMKWRKNDRMQTATIDNGQVKADVEIDIGDLGYSDKLFLEATIREKHTNITATAESVIKVRWQRYQIIVPDSSMELHENKTSRLKIYVQYWNGTAVTDRTEPVKMYLKDKTYSTYLNGKGMAELEFIYEPASFFDFSYNGASSYHPNVLVEQSSHDLEKTNCHLKMRIRKSDSFSTPIEIDVTANHNIPYLIYTITSHGNIIRDEFIRLASNQKSYTMRLKATMAMVPQSYLFVHYIVNDQLHYCELTIRLTQNFENQLAITAPTNVKPGQQITLNIKGQPNSRVFILAVDKSVLLLSTDNVLQKKRIMNDLLNDRSYRFQPRDVHTYQYYPGHTSGLLIMTNAKYEVHTIDISAGPLPSHGPTIQRTLFPETWIYQDIDIEAASTAVTIKVPDTITTWIVRAFSINDESGFGMMDETLDIEAFQPFFISLNLPYSVKRGEIVTIPVTIFNYLRQNLLTEVTMANDHQDFQFIDDRNRPSDKKEDKRSVNVPANNGKSVAFKISPNRVGKIAISIKAQNSIASDGLVQKLKVEPEGIKHERNRDELLTLQNKQTKKISFLADIPADIVPESEYVVLSVSGDIMVSTLDNLEDLVQKPTGCGEQNMMNLSPNILILDYLKALDKYNNETKLVGKAKNFIETGYQQELTYRHESGGYSVFGPRRKSVESNWLTAYVTRFFMKGMKYSAIEPRIIQGGLDYLASQQLDDGSFPQRGYLFHPAHQNQYGFTAFVLLTFLEEEKYSRKYNNVLQKGLNFLTSNSNNVNDVYSLAIMANAFQKAGNNAKANEILTKLKSMSKEENGLKWWTSNNDHEESANNVEITSYILIALLESRSDYLPIFNWLIKQRNSHGGFQSTHDTVVGLQALIKYAEKSIQTHETQLKVRYKAKTKGGQSTKENQLSVDTDNELVFQKQELPSNTRSVDVEVTGTGRVYLQFSYQYYTATVHSRPDNSTLSRSSDRQSSYMPSTPSTPSRMGAPEPLTAMAQHQYFIIKSMAKMSSSLAMALNICYAYQPLTLEETLTNMVILQIQLLSGYTTNSENMRQLGEDERVSRIDSQNSATMLEIYFETLSANNEECLTIMADKIHDVASLKPASIKMYDFYNPQRSSVILYNV